MISFLHHSHLIQGYSTPLRKNRTLKGGGILLYVREDTPCKIIITETDAYYWYFNVFPLKLT